MAHFSSGPKRERRQKRLLVFAGVATAALLLALLFVLLVASTPSPTHVSSSSGQQAGSTVARQEQHSLAHYERTAAPMPLLPPYEPACAVSPDQRERAGCPVLACSLAPTCTTRDKRCCAHLHLQVCGGVVVSARACGCVPVPAVAKPLPPSCRCCCF
jgi:hypothetical protein